jgi:hypothetical protein
VEIEFVTLAIRVPLTLPQLERTDLAVGAVVGYLGTKLGHRQQVVGVHAEKHTLANTFLSEQSAVNNHSGTIRKHMFI